MKFTKIVIFEVYKFHCFMSNDGFTLRVNNVYNKCTTNFGTHYILISYWFFIKLFVIHTNLYT